MHPQDLLLAGVRVLGLYFGLTGLNTIWIAFVALLFSENPHGQAFGIALLKSALFVASGYAFFAKPQRVARWCLSRGDASPRPEYAPPRPEFAERAPNPRDTQKI